jgi:fructose-bisphosphate aldolase class II
MTGAFRRIATEDRSQFDPRKFLQPALDAMQALCRDRFEQFGTAGKAGKIRPLGLAEMARRYRSGALDPEIDKQSAA